MRNFFLTIRANHHYEDNLFKIFKNNNSVSQGTFLQRNREIFRKESTLYFGQFTMGPAKCKKMIELLLNKCIQSDSCMPPTQHCAREKNFWKFKISYAFGHLSSYSL